MMCEEKFMEWGGVQCTVPLKQQPIPCPECVQIYSKQQSTWNLATNSGNKQAQYLKQCSFSQGNISTTHKLSFYPLIIWNALENAQCPGGKDFTLNNLKDRRKWTTVYLILTMEQQLIFSFLSSDQFNDREMGSCCLCGGFDLIPSAPRGGPHRALCFQ